MRFIKLLILIVTFFFQSKLSLSIEKQSCNTNDHCRALFVCLNGTAGNGDINYTGKCVVMMPFRQLCLLQKILTGNFGKGIIAIVLISMGAAFAFGKMENKQLITFVVGVSCIYGSFQVVALLTGDRIMVCELVDTKEDLGQDF